MNDLQTEVLHAIRLLPLSTTALKAIDEIVFRPQLARLATNSIYLRLRAVDADPRLAMSVATLISVISDNA